MGFWDGLKLPGKILIIVVWVAAFTLCALALAGVS